MSKPTPAKLALAAPETLPLDKLVVHDANVRQIKADISIEGFATDIARRGLLQSLSVRPLLDDAGVPTGTFGVQAETHSRLTAAPVTTFHAGYRDGPAHPRLVRNR